MIKGEDENVGEVLQSSPSVSRVEVEDKDGSTNKVSKIKSTIDPETLSRNLMSIKTGGDLRKAKKTKCGVKCCCSFYWRLTLTLLCYYSLFSSGIIYPMTGPTLVLLSEYYEVSESATSIIFIIKAAGMLIGGLVLGPMCDIALSPKFFLSNSLNKILFMSACLVSVPMLLIPFIPFLVGGAVMSFFQGLGFAAQLVVTTVLVKELWPMRLVFPLLQLLHFFFAIGAMVAPLVVGWVYSLGLSSKINLIIIYVCSGVIGLATGFIILCPSPKKVSENHMSHNYQMFDEQEGKNKKKNGEEEEERKKKKKSPLIFFKKIITCVKGLDFLRVIFFLVACISVIGFVAVDGTFQSIQFLFLVRDGWDESAASYITSVFFLAYALGRAVGVIVGIYLTPVQLFFVDVTGVTITLVAMLVFYGVTDVITVVGIFLTGFFCATAFASFFTIPTEFGILITGFESSVMISCASLGLVFPTITTLLIERYGSIWFLIMEVIFACSAFLAWYVQFALGHIYLSLKKKKKEKKKKENREREEE